MSMLLLEPTPRRIIWIWSLESSMGKTTFKKYVQFHLQQDFLLGSMKINDTMYAYESQKVIWFDILDNILLDAELTSQLETLSDGGVVGSSKYKSSNKIVDAHIVVTTNRPPPDDKLPNRIIAFQAYINLSPFCNITSFMDKYTLLDKKLDSILEIVQKIITLVECLSEEDTFENMEEDSDSDATQEFYPTEKRSKRSKLIRKRQFRKKVLRQRGTFYKLTTDQPVFAWAKALFMQDYYPSATGSYAVFNIAC